MCTRGAPLLAFTSSPAFSSRVRFASRSDTRSSNGMAGSHHGSTASHHQLAAGFAAEWCDGEGNVEVGIDVDADASVLPTLLHSRNRATRDHVACARTLDSAGAQFATKDLAHACIVTARGVMSRSRLLTSMSMCFFSLRQFGYPAHHEEAGVGVVLDRARQRSRRRRATMWRARIEIAHAMHKPFMQAFRPSYVRRSFSFGDDGMIYVPR
eukprot:2961130-Pleurochrysis_carterae.AAC.2